MSKITTSISSFASISNAIWPLYAGVTFYLIHSMNAQKGKYALVDRIAAENMVAVTRII